MTETARGRAIRIGEAERTTAIDRLNHHLSAGRLDVDEYAERMARASLARTEDELTSLFLDLPAVGVDPSVRAAPLRVRRKRSPRWLLSWLVASLSPMFALAGYYGIDRTGVWFAAIPASIVIAAAPELAARRRPVRPPRRRRY